MIKFLFVAAFNFLTFSEAFPLSPNFELADGKTSHEDRVPFEEYLKIHYPTPWTNEDEVRDELVDCDVSRRNAMAHGSSIWENGTVPYVVRNLSPKNLEKLNVAFAYYHNFTCIRLRPKQESDEDYIVIDGNTTACSSLIGNHGGEQVVQLSDRNCFSQVGTAFHEVMHTLGFDHEHSRHDRDEYITVNTANIVGEDLGNFEVVNGTSYNLKYDFGSVMHYSLYAFGKNKSIPTIISKVLLKKDIVVGQRTRPSEQDLLKINIMYKCSMK